jgi:hypothetical protein
MNVEIGTEAAQFLLGEDINWDFHYFQWFTKPVKNTDMTDCISSPRTLLNTCKDNIKGRWKRETMGVRKEPNVR